MTERTREGVLGWARRHPLALSCLGGAVAVILLGLAVIMAMPTTYRATSVLAVRAAPETPVSTDALRLIAHEYAVRITSSESLNATARDLGIDPRELRSMIEVKTDADATVIRAVAESEDGLEAVGIANHLAQSGVRQSFDDSDVRVQIISLAGLDDAATGPPRLTYLLLLVGMTVTLAAALWYVVSGRRSASPVPEEIDSAADFSPAPPSEPPLVYPPLLRSVDNCDTDVFDAIPRTYRPANDRTRAEPFSRAVRYSEGKDS